MFYNSFQHATTPKKWLSIDLSNTGSLRCFQKHYYDCRPSSGSIKIKYMGYTLDLLKEWKRFDIVESHY